MTAYLEFGGSTHRMRVSPYSVNWTYNLVTANVDTYGGKITQILGIHMGDLSVTGVCGRGGKAELAYMANVFRNLILWQNDSRRPAKFTFPERNYSFKVWGKSFSKQDSLDNVEYAYRFDFNIQEDQSGIASGDTMKTELNRISSGIGYTPSVYNDPLFRPGEGLSSAM